MGAVVKNPITQLTQASAPQPPSALFVDESLAESPLSTRRKFAACRISFPSLFLSINPPLRSLLFTK